MNEVRVDDLSVRGIDYSHQTRDIDQNPNHRARKPATSFPHASNLTQPTLARPPSPLPERLRRVS